MVFDQKKKKLFDDAYTEYLKISKIIEELYNEAVSDPFYERPSITDVTCDLDLYIQGRLLRMGLSKGNISEEEKEFIMSLPDELDELCSRKKGYSKFLREIDVESFNNNSFKFYDFENIPQFFKMIREEDEDSVNIVIDSLEKIFNSYIAMDGVISDCENRIAVDTINILKETKGNSKVKSSENKKIKIDINENGHISEVMQELEDLIGLSGVKQEVLTSINLLKVNNLRKEKGLPELQISRHMVFTGQPGTGKTTVARIIAKIYKSLGVVSKGHLIETDRSGMVAGYVGQTALKTAQVIKKAKGGVLFIDEAYALSSEDGSNDYGKEAIDTLVKGMEDYRDDLVVIVAGYTDEMQNFINMNPGLRSRFNKYINFVNYTGVEMLEIFRSLCEKTKFILSPEAERKALQYFQCNEGDELFGNARGVRNFFDRVVTKQATRILTIDNPSEIEFRTIKVEDVE